MNLQRTYSIDSDLIKAFEEAIPSGGRSQVIGELMKDYLNKFFPDKSNAKLLREIEKQKATAKLEELMIQEREETEKREWIESNNRKIREEEIKRLDRDKRLDDAVKRAKIITNMTFGLDPNSELLPEDWPDEKRMEYKSFWRDQTKKEEGKL